MRIPYSHLAQLRESERFQGLFVDGDKPTAIVRLPVKKLKHRHKEAYIQKARSDMRCEFIGLGAGFGSFVSLLVLNKEIGLCGIVVVPMSHPGIVRAVSVGWTVHFVIEDEVLFSVGLPALRDDAPQLELEAVRTAEEFGADCDQRTAYWSVVCSRESEIGDLLTPSDRLSMGWFQLYWTGTRKTWTLLEEFRKRPRTDGVEDAKTRAFIMDLWRWAASSRNLIALVEEVAKIARESWSVERAYSSWLNRAIQLADHADTTAADLGRLLASLWGLFYRGPQETDCGRRLPVMRMDGQPSYIKLNPGKFPAHIDPEIYWNRVPMERLLGWDKHVKGHEIPMEFEDPASTPAWVPQGHSMERHRELVGQFLAEVETRGEGDIPEDAEILLEGREFQLGRVTEFKVSLGDPKADDLRMALIKIENEAGEFLLVTSPIGWRGAIEPAFRTSRGPYLPPPPPAPSSRFALPESQRLLIRPTRTTGRECQEAEVPFSASSSSQD